jgi:hypothetical protein
MTMFSQDNLFKARARSIMLCLLMVLSTTAALATTASASQARTYTTNRDPHDVAIGDFNCDTHNDIAIATDGTHTITVLWNDGNGDFSERQDIWVTANQDRNADWDEFSNVQFIEVGDFTNDGVDDIVIFQRNNPFKTNEDGSPAGEPGNVTIIENGGCNEKTWSIGARFTHFWAWDLEVADLNDDGNDDVMVLDLQADITTQRVVTYLGPITSNTQGIITNLGPAQQNTYRAFTAGDWGESQVGGGLGGGGTCFDSDMWLLRSAGLDYATGQVTNPGHDDNVSIVEFNCQTNTFPLTYTFSTTPGVGEHVINMQTETSSDLAVADLDGDGTADVLALNDADIENVTYVTSSTSGTWTSPQKAYFGPYISWTLTVADLNGDQQPDFINPTLAYQQNSTDSAGGTSSNFFLNYPTSIQVTLSDGSGGHLSPLSYAAGRRPHTAEVGQLAGGANSAPDIVVAHKNWRFGGWRDNFGWDGQYDTISVIEMDSQDLSVSGIEISPVDRSFGVVGEGLRDINVTVTNTGMNVLNGQSATLDVELKVVDELNSTNQTVYANDWDTPENVGACGSGCTWDYIDYVDGNHHWNEQTTPSSGSGTDPDESQADYSANYLNPTHFMWSGETKTNSTGGEWTGYGANWDEAMVLRDVDLTGSDRAFMSVELFQDLGFGALGSADTNGFVVGDVWDDLAMIEVGSEETGWSTISCPVTAYIEGACWSRTSMWGGFDTDRVIKENAYGGYAEGLYYYGIQSFNTFYAWNNFTDEGLGTFDLSPWAGETVDLRFRFRTGFEGSISDENESTWTGNDGFAFDNLTIFKQNTAFFPNVQNQQTQIQLNNLGPGQEYVANLQANFMNDTTYRISAVLSNNGWDEQVLNDEIVGYVTPFNLYDPALESIDYFEPGQLYAQGTYPISATTNNYGNTIVDFDVTATVFTADPDTVQCGNPGSDCIITFDNSTDGTRYTQSNNPKGTTYNDTLDCPSDLVFNSNSYWFGHPCQTATLGYGDAWENETMTITDIDLEDLESDFVSLSFEYYADTFFEVDSQGNIEPSDYMAVTVDFTKDSTDNTAIVYGQWNDYNEDGTCQIDEDGNGIVNETNPIDFEEIEYIGDPRTTDGLSGNWNVFFNSDRLVKTTTLDLTHLYVLNTTSPDSGEWDTQCISLADSTVDLNFDFFSDDDGRNGINDGFKGVGINNITLKEFTFVEDNSYSISRTSVDAEDSSTDLIAEHDFVSGVYMVEVETIFDNTTVGTNWYGNDELSTANNIKRVIFDVKSVDIVLSQPKRLACLDEVRQNCVLPIDSSLTHNWEMTATNGVLEGDYVFYMEVFDETTGSLAHSVSAGPAQSLLNGERIALSFTPWAGYQDGHTYNISYRAQLDDGTPSGDPVYFHATFADEVDIAILSDKTSGTSRIIEDIAANGMSYTQFAMNDWDDYFKTNWFTNFDKIILPWQDFNTAKDDGKAYYKTISDTVSNVDRKQVLVNFMSSGGTIQAHLAPHGTQTYGLQTNVEPRLPLGLVIDDKTNGAEITYADMEVYDEFHPIMNNIDENKFEVFTPVANSALDIGSEATSDVPKICSGNQNVASFQPIIRDSTSIEDVLLGICSYGQGGMIISTIDLEAKSGNASSSDFALLSNVLAYQVNDYPNPFGEMRDGTDILIDGVVPDPALGAGYATVYMKSNAQLTFSYQSDAQVSLQTDWLISGPTSWDLGTMAPGQIDHYTSPLFETESSPVMDFCKSIGTQGECKQGEQWTITLWLHDDNGHSRMLSVTVETNDANADAFNPIADAYVVMKDSYADNIEYVGTCSSLDNYPKYEITLDESGQLPIDFNAFNSTDPDALEGNGIERYEWEVLFDKPWDQAINVNANTYIQYESSLGVWQYTFGGYGVDENGESYAGRNLTYNPNTESPIQPIKIKLTVYDKSGKWDDDMEFCFDVKPQGFGDEPPVIEFTNWGDQQGYTNSFYNLSGFVVSGSDESDTYVEITWNESLLDQTDVRVRETAKGTKELAVLKNPVGTSDSFQLSLDIDRFHSNNPVDVIIYIRIYEFDPLKDSEKRWNAEQQLPLNDPNYVQLYNPSTITLSLPICRGVTVPDDVILADPEGKWIFINGECDWDGEYSLENGEWVAPSSNDGGDGAQSDSNIMVIGVGAVILILIVVLTLLFLRRSGGDGMDGDYKDFSLTGAFQEQDPVEQYVQQLIAQGYPEDTARSYAAQYAAQAGLTGGGAQPQQQATQAATPAATNPAMDAAYQQYYQQFITQGYDEQTAAAYAQQYAAAYIQQQG